MPGPQEEDDGQRADQQHGTVFGHEKEAPAETGVLGVESGDQFTLCFSQVKRGPIDTCHATGDVDPEYAKCEGIVENQPVGSKATLHFTNRGQIHRAADEDGNHHAQSQRDFVTDDLGRFPHGAKQRPFRPGCIASQNHSEDFQAKHRQDKEDGDVHVQAGPSDGEGHRQPGGKTGGKTYIRRNAEQHRVCLAWGNVFFGDQLDAVSQCLQPAKTTTDTGGAESILNSSGDLALQPNEDQRADRHQMDNEHTGHQGANDVRQGLREPYTCQQVN